jgi:PTH1 family peptidyl-tRNA hydrolase
MKLIVGLGNPGKQYENTRHNVGFILIDEIVRSWGAQGPFFKFESEVYECEVDGQKVLLQKPQTFMNLSGKAVQPLMDFYKLSVSDLIVIHDDLDLPPIEFRLKRGGGTGGHNGLKSIEECLGGKNSYERVRIGIGKNPQIEAASYVLGKIPTSEMNQLQEKFKDIESAIRLMLRGKIQEAMNCYHRKKEDQKNGI